MVTRRHLLLVGLVALSAAYLLVGGLGTIADTPSEGDAINRSKLVQPTDNGTYLWPYTSRKRASSGRTLAINLVIHGEDDRVRRALTEQTSLDWRAPIDERRNDSADNETGVGNDTVTGTPEDAPGTVSMANITGNETANGTETPTRNETGNGTANVTDNGTANGTANATEAPGPGPRQALQKRIFEWADAHGSTRYTYFDGTPRGGSGQWVDESYQIHAGAYLGSRHHIRAYAAPRDDWTAIQVHQEYWDWFRLRHTVTDIRNARNQLEAEFIGQPYVTDVTRTYYGINRGWNDGWLSEIHLGPAMLAVVGLIGLISSGTRRALGRDAAAALRWTGRNVRGLVTMAVLAGLYLGVRSAGIYLESLSSVDPRAFVAVLYPIIALGLPVVAFVFAQPFGATSRFERLQRIARLLGPRIDPTAAFGFSFVGLCAAFVLDFGGIGIRSVPIELAIHRVGLAVALGLIAAGATRIDERGGSLLLVGALGWLVGLAMPLFGYL
ncbi:hypothetical protein BV210_07330 [Halorientalis sp. IM1011]|uniref:hypothetical protein n=1 Tax=Halorientalis sp. IM1011 TaxID=1932360 RepID=UPI00097CC910|nr:hypothetical protein [Halorientalis sp. IM1011]AQL42533.1 hypothetical protein BV210_07330 [Halorientalis sp. IM1011]